MYNQAELKEHIDKALQNLSYNCEAPRLIDPVKYILSIGGKRLRPVMALMACNIFSDKIDDAVMPATGLEIFHNFTLVHDDIMDHAPIRRGLPTIHTKYNLNQAILSGDVMAFIANDCFLQTPPAYLGRVLKVYNKAATAVCSGQQLDMDFENASFISLDEYLRMIELKTAVLLAAALKIGAIIGGADDKSSETMYEFGRNLGIAFQIQDDLLDVWGDSKQFGKKPGGDILANKKTFPLVKAMETASGAQRKQLQKLFSGSESDPEEKIREVVSIYESLNIKEISETLVYDYFNAAFTLLQKISVSEERKKEMTNLAISLIGRNY
jgi:geranylgeranyl diphosphate synthase type II